MNEQPPSTHLQVLLWKPDVKNNTTLLQLLVQSFLHQSEGGTPEKSTHCKYHTSDLMNSTPKPSLRCTSATQPPSPHIAHSYGPVITHFSRLADGMVHQVLGTHGEVHFNLCVFQPAKAIAATRRMNDRGNGCRAALGESPCPSVCCLWSFDSYLGY